MSKCKTVKRYSESFKRQVVREYEEGATIGALRRKYGIGGANTIQRWVRTYGREGLRHQVVRVQTAAEADQGCRLQRQIQQLLKALAQTLLDKLAAGQALALY